MKVKNKAKNFEMWQNEILFYNVMNIHGIYVGYISWKSDN